MTGETNRQGLCGIALLMPMGFLRVQAVRPVLDWRSVIMSEKGGLHFESVEQVVLRREPLGKEEWASVVNNR